MRTARAWLIRLSGLFRKQTLERELAREMESHLAMHIEDNLRAGMTQEQARREALLKLGGVVAGKEAWRDRSTIPLVEHLFQDTRFSLRQLRRNPGFTVTAVLMLALGMCASVAIFAFVDAAVFKPLPYANPQQLLGVYEKVAVCPLCNLSYPDYLDWKKLNKTLSSLDVYQRNSFLLSTASGTEPARGARVSDGFFRTLGVRPVLGRDFQSGEDLPGAPRTVLLSNAAWRNRYGANPDVLGKTVTLDGEPNVIIGVLPPDFNFAPTEPAEFWTTLHASGGCDLRRSCHSLFGVARLKDGVSLSAALSDLTQIARQLETQYPDSNRGQSAAVLPLSEVIVGNVRPLLMVLLGGAVLLLLIACVNITSLVLVRAESRRREIAVRNALGASSARLAGQFITEGLLLTAAGTALGLASAWWAMHLLTKLIPEMMFARMPYLHGLRLNGRVQLFAAAMALIAALLFAFTPALHLSFSKMRVGLSEGARGSAGNTWRRLGSKLVVLELAIAVVLLVGAGLLGKSLYRLLQVDLGFEPDRLTTLQVASPKAVYTNEKQKIALGRQIVASLSSLPGVKSAAIASLTPVSGNGNTDWIRFVGRPYNGEHNEVNERDVSAGYFTTIGTKLLRGRYFRDDEDISKQRVVVINRALAKQYFPNEDPIGKRIGDTQLTPQSLKEIIGVVDDIREGQLDAPVWPAVYYPFNQSPDNFFAVLICSSQSGAPLITTIEGALRNLNAGLVMRDGMTMTKLIRDSPAAYARRSSAWLVGAFAIAAFLLSVAGLYGVIAYSVSQRTREIGVRMALGAQRSTVYRLILKDAGRLAVLGIVCGFACSIAASRAIRGLLFGTAAWDASTLAAVALVLGAAALAASFIPARRAASVNPVEALRAE